MKTSFSLARSLSAAALGIAFVTLASTHTVSGQIIANFDHGETNKEVDGNPGKPGDGWANAWTNPTPGAGRTLQRTVTNARPLTPESGNYLAITMTNSTVSGSASRTELVRRTYENYGVVSRSHSHTISFLYRVDEPTSGNSAGAPAIFDSARNTSVADATSSFYLRVLGGNWTYYSGPDTWTSTAVPMIYDDTYQFTIHLDPVAKRWGFSMVNLNDSAFSFSADSIPFFGTEFYGANARDSVGGQLQWSMTLGDRPTSEAPLNSITYTVDSIMVIPEPGVSTLFLGAGVFLMAGRLVTRRR